MLLKTTTHQYFFETKLQHLEGRKGLLNAPTVDQEILVATPPEFPGGVEGIWNPEQLFLASLSSCLMTTYLAFAAKKNLAVATFECNAIGRVELVEGRLEFTTIDLYPKISVCRDEDLAIANEVLLKTYKHCIIANSIKAHLVHHGEVIVAKAEVAEKI